jgi:glycerol kinase
VFGITRGSTRAHLVRATLEAIAFEVRDVYDAMAGRRDGGAPVLRVDGGGSANNLLMQMQADQLQVPVERAGVTETTALGAAFLAGLGTGVWSSLEEIAATWRQDRRFEPRARDDAGYAMWRRAVERSRGWAREPADGLAGTGG